jgi:hypothetical protein
MKTLKDLKELVAPGKFATFVKFKGTELIYTTECGIEFPVPVADINGEAEVLSVERTMTLMKWLRSHLKSIENEESMYNFFEEDDATHQG